MNFNSRPPRCEGGLHHGSAWLTIARCQLEPIYQPLKRVPNGLVPADNGSLLGSPNIEGYETLQRKLLRISI